MSAAASRSCMRSGPWCSSLVPVHSHRPRPVGTVDAACARHGASRPVDAVPAARHPSAGPDRRWSRHHHTAAGVGPMCGLAAGGRAVVGDGDGDRGPWAPGYVTLTAASAPPGRTCRISTTGPPRRWPTRPWWRSRPTERSTSTSSSSVHVLVDVAGVFVDAAGPASSGRFAPSAPSRLVDTRMPEGPPRAGDLVVPAAGRRRPRMRPPSRSA